MNKRIFFLVTLVFLCFSSLFFRKIDKIEKYMFNRKYNILSNDEVLLAANKFLEKENLLLGITYKYLEDDVFKSKKKISFHKKNKNFKINAITILLNKKDYGKQKLNYSYKLSFIEPSSVKYGDSLTTKDIRYILKKFHDISKIEDKNCFQGNQASYIILDQAIKLHFFFSNIKEKDIYAPEAKEFKVQFYIKRSIYNYFKKKFSTGKKIQIEELTDEYLRIIYKINKNIDKYRKVNRYLSKIAEIKTNFAKMRPDDKKDEEDILDDYFFENKKVKKLYQKLRYNSELIQNKEYKREVEKYLLRYAKEWSFIRKETFILKTQAKTILKILDETGKVNTKRLEEKTDNIFSNNKKLELVSIDSEFLIYIDNFFDGDFDLNKDCLLAGMVPFTREFSYEESKKYYLSVCKLREQIKLLRDKGVLKYKILFTKVINNPYRIRWYRKEILKCFKREGHILDFFILNSVNIYYGITGGYLIYMILFLVLKIKNQILKERIRIQKDLLSIQAQAKREKELKEEKEEFMVKVRTVLEEVKKEDPSHSILNKGIEEITKEELYGVESEILDVILKKEQKAKDRKKEEGNIKKASDLLKEIQDAEVLKELKSKLEEIKEELKTTKRPKKLDRKITKLIDEIQEAITKQD